MENIVKQFKEWTDEVRKQPVNRWNDLPDIELYMDQVITYIEKQLSSFKDDDEGKLITSSMINNYVKDGLIKHAVSKKYSKEHLASLVMIGLLKQVLPLSQISKLTNIFYEAEKKDEIYDTFLEKQYESIDNVLSNLNIDSNEENEEKQLFLTAISLSCMAVANRIAAERIFKMIKVNNIEIEKKKKDISKIKEKKHKAIKQETL